ncbi:class I SAM-dependent RNA methyltransferase [Lacibacterium aquatile]|uniref:Class I SAM-dependent RNA methyltransferase n=1 Tax=Lacibacterium aquatile TaxID=1168082 RepID=A0ABW5DQS9_9PROT
MRSRRPPSRAGHRPAAKPPVEVAEVTIDRLGLQGEGIAKLQGKPLYIRGALAGETVSVRLIAKRGEGWFGRTEKLISGKHAERVTPVCRHADRCGGCSLQHLDLAAQARLKTERVKLALARVELDDTPVRPIISSAPGSRRRASFGLRGVGKGIVVGFNEAASSQLIDLKECPVLVPELTAMIPPLRASMATVLGTGETCDAVATLTRDGIDLLLTGGPRLTLAAREQLAAFADSLDIARITWREAGQAFDEPLSRRRPATVDLGGLIVEPPPGAFLQATVDGQAALIAAILEAIPANARKIADLYAGCGTFAGALAKRGAAVHAVEGLREPLAALDRAARHSQMRVTTEVRDLDKDPIPAAFLKDFDAIVFDPPRAGAKRQAEDIAMSGVKHVVAVSCDPDTFARDAAILVDGGYDMNWVQPVDQFTWSGHIEVVASFTKAGSGYGDAVSVF